jgi:hypothetical protein
MKYKLTKNKKKIGNITCYDPSFEYKIRERVEIKKPNLSNKSCSSGIHFSHPEYWDEGDTLRCLGAESPVL